ncbi:MAG: hypothetical protein RIQ88_889 [Actinomycetota bacterium]|jgi:preprotein translocase subunit YajC
MELVLLLTAGIFLVMVIFSNRKRRAQAQALNEGVKVGVKVVMLGGVTGKVVSISDDSVVIESTPGTRIEFLKAAVRNIVQPSLDDKPEPKPKKSVTATAKSTPAAAAKKSPAKKSTK